MSDVDDALAVALGVKQAPPDPRQLTAERDQALAAVAQRDAAIREHQLEAAVLRHAGRHGGNGAQLADSKTFMAKVAGLDPASDSFGDDLGDAIRGAVDSSPRFRAAGPAAPAARPAGDREDTAAETRQWTIADVDAATPAQVAAALEAGLLADLGGPRARSVGEHNDAPSGNQQWTEADVDRATAAQVNAAVEAGLLVDLGFPPPKRRR